MEGERIIFTHEAEPEHGVRIVASGAVDEELIDAVEMFVELQKKRLGLATKKSKDKACMNPRHAATVAEYDRRD